MMWWGYPLLLFCISFLIGIVSVVAGIGGGAIYMPVVAAFFPFDFNIIRGSSTLLTLGSGLSSIPRLLKKGFADVRLALPFALTSAIFSIVGAKISFAINEQVLKIILGVVMLAVSGFMFFGKSKMDPPLSNKKDFLAKAFNMQGFFKSSETDVPKEWRARNTFVAVFLFAFIGILSGMFGIGGGWAGVPVLNLITGIPLKLAAGTSSIIISANSSSAVWVYIAKGAVFPLVALPSFLGVSLGSKLGARLMGKINSNVIRWIITAFLCISGIRMIIENI